MSKERKGGETTKNKHDKKCSRANELTVSQVLDHVLVNGVSEVQYLNILLVELIHEVRGLHLLFGLSREVVNLILPVLHSANVLLKAHKVILAIGLAGMVSKELRELATVGIVLNDAHLEAGSKLLVPLNVLVGFIVILVVILLLDLNHIAISVDLSFLGFTIVLAALALLLTVQGKLADHLYHLSHKLLLDDLDNLRLLKRLSVDVEGEVVGINNLNL